MQQSKQQMYAALTSKQQKTTTRLRPLTKMENVYEKSQPQTIHIVPIHLAVSTPHLEQTTKFNANTRVDLITTLPTPKEG